MNLKSRKVRLPIAALGACALVTGGGVLAAGTAFAAGTLTITPTSTSVTTLDVGATATVGATNYQIAQPLSDATFASHISSSGMTSLKLAIESYTAPSGVSAVPYVYMAEKATGGTTGPVVDTDGGTAGVQGSWTRVDATGATSTVPVLSSGFTLNGSGASVNDIFLAPSAPGVYKIHFVDGGTQSGTDDDNVSPTVTLTVLDAEAVSGTPAGSTWTPSVTNSASSASIGAPVTGSVSLSALTLADARGSSSGAGVLGGQIADLVGVKFSGTPTGAGSLGNDISAYNTPTAGTFGTNAVTRTIAAGATAHAGTITTTAVFDKTGTGTIGTVTNAVGGNPTTDVVNNNVSAVSLTAKNVTGSVKVDATGTPVYVKSGTKSVTWQAKVTDSDTDKSGNIVYFTVTGTDAASVTSDGTTVDSVNHIFSAPTDSDGVASLTLTDGASTPAATSYSVSAASNNFTSGTAIPVSYGDSSVAAVKITSPSSDLTQPTTTSSVTITGSVVDQFGDVSQPGSSANQQVAVSGAATGNASLSGGKFSYTFSPSSTPAAGSTSNLTFTYGAKTATAVIRWTTTTAAGALALNSPSNGSTGVALQAGTSTPTSSVQVTGLVKDSSSATLAGAPVTLTGTDGVYFSTSATPGSAANLEKSLTTVSDTSGAINGIYAFFTKAGDATITAKSGSVTATTKVTTAVAAGGSAYVVTADDAKVKPGSTITLTGKVTDAFGNPVPSTQVDLALDTPSAGTLAASSDQTDANGIWAVSFSTTSNQSGTPILTATLHNQTVNATPNANWALASVAIPNGVYKATADVTVGVLPLTITSSPQLTYGSKYYARGALLGGTGADANADVDIYAKVPGGTYALIDTVKADAEGEFGVAEKISKSTYFLAKSGGASSSASATRVYSGVVLTAKSSKADRVTLSANGGPNATATLVFYRVYANGDTAKVGSVKSTAYGNGSITVKAPSGNRIYKVLFQAPGTTTGSDTVHVKVK